MTDCFVEILVLKHILQFNINTRSIIIICASSLNCLFVMVIAKLKYKIKSRAGMWKTAEFGSCFLASDEMDLVLHFERGNHFYDTNN